MQDTFQSPRVSEPAATSTLAGSCRSRPGARGLLPQPPASARGTLTTPVGRPAVRAPSSGWLRALPLFQAINSRRAGTVSCSFFCFQGQEQCPAHGGPQQMKVYGRSQRWTPGRACWNPGPSRLPGEQQCALRSHVQRWEAQRLKDSNQDKTETE